MPVLLGAKPEWSFCAWVYADRNARTLYYERDAAATTCGPPSPPSPLRRLS